MDEGSDVGSRGSRLMTEEEFHPTCDVCGKYIFAVDGCKGHAVVWETVMTDGHGND